MPEPRVPLQLAQGVAFPAACDVTDVTIDTDQGTAVFRFAR